MGNVALTATTDFSLKKDQSLSSSSPEHVPSFPFPPVSSSYLKKSTSLIIPRPLSFVNDHFAQFTSEEYSSALTIQNAWRFYASRKKQQPSTSRASLYTTSLGTHRKVTRDTERIRYLLDVRKVDYEVVDFVSEPHRRTEVIIDTVEDLPVLLVNGELIGGLEVVQRLEDQNLLALVLRGEHRSRCLFCGERKKPSQGRCPSCWIASNFFVLSHIYDTDHFGDVKSLMRESPNRSFVGTSSGDENQVGVRCLLPHSWVEDHTVVSELEFPWVERRLPLPRRFSFSV
eukprot:GILI01042700.1.p1 GENE.GILI01042700.1~~GILI01042700.1.p1  ORF type:complete len:286 (-),score=18.50 GILI01042700.1:91-948(-)